MATRALAAAAVAAGRRRGGQPAGLAVLSSTGSCCMRGGKSQSFSHSSSSSAAERDHERDAHADAGAEVTAAQVEAALNSKNVEVVQGDSSATLLAADAAEALRGVGDDGDGEVAGAEDAWVPDQETGVFVPADEAAAAASSGDGDVNGQAGPPSSVLDQAVFVREDDIEDVERPAAGGGAVADAGAK